MRDFAKYEEHKGGREGRDFILLSRLIEERVAFDRPRSIDRVPTRRRGFYINPRGDEKLISSGWARANDNRLRTQREVQGEREEST